MMLFKSIALSIALVVNLSSASEDGLRTLTDCRNDYVCPANSCRIPGHQCYNDFEDCECNRGYEKSTREDKCVPISSPVRTSPVRSPVCRNDYVCPANSYRIPDQQCYNTFNDCRCKSGYEKSTREDKCIPVSTPVRTPVKAPVRSPVRSPVCKNDYVCPANSYRISGHQCYDDFEDCRCKSGYEKSTTEDKCIPTCLNDYVCPANSYRLPGHQCYNDFEDCECNDGYYKSATEDKCISVCKNDYICPANSYRIPNRECYDDFGDCECNTGYYKSSTEDKCIRSPTPAPVKPPTAAPVKPPTNAPVKPPTKAPRRPPTAAPVKPPTKAPRKPPTTAPVKPPTKAPRKPPTTAPVKPPTHAPVKPPTKAPRLPPIAVPIKPPTNAPVLAPTCKNDYVCPAFSCRIEHRDCYDNFDDCVCLYGYYKSPTEDVCLKHSWCKW